MKIFVFSRRFFVILQKIQAKMNHRNSSVFSDSKPHYEILDGLRGVAALLVIFYHVFECFDWSPAPHGYLAVDFFFVLSGFVIGYAYDDRWNRMTT